MAHTSSDGIRLPRQQNAFLTIHCNFGLTVDDFHNLLATVNMRIRVPVRLDPGDEHLAVVFGESGVDHDAGMRLAADDIRDPERIMFDHGSTVCRGMKQSL